MNRLLCISAVLLFMSNIFGQNNYPEQYPLYYNLKDTSTCHFKESIQLPICLITNQTLQDSLDHYIKVAIDNRYEHYDDSNGVVFFIYLSTFEPDTTSMQITIRALMNYYLYEYAVRSISHNNHWRPKDYWDYYLGAVTYNNNIVLILTNYRQPQEELDVFLKKTDDSIILRLFEEEPIGSYGEGLSPSLSYSVPLVNPNNFKSPKFPRKR